MLFYKHSYKYLINLVLRIFLKFACGFTFSCCKNCWRSVRLLSRRWGRSRTLHAVLRKESSCPNCEGEARCSFRLQFLVILPVAMVLPMMVVLPMFVILPTLAAHESAQGQRGRPIDWVELHYSCLQWSCRFTVSCLEILLDFLTFRWLVVLTMSNGTTAHLLFLRLRGNGRDIWVTSLSCIALTCGYLDAFTVSCLAATLEA